MVKLDEISEAIGDLRARVDVGFTSARQDIKRLDEKIKSIDTKISNIQNGGCSELEGVDRRLKSLEHGKLTFSKVVMYAGGATTIGMFIFYASRATALVLGVG